MSYQWSIIGAADLIAFKRSWPCHGLPDNLLVVKFQFAPNGDLVDIEAVGDAGELLDSSEFDGPAMVALADDAKAKLAPRGV